MWTLSPAAPGDPDPLPEQAARTVSAVMAAASATIGCFFMLLLVRDPTARLRCQVCAVVRGRPVAGGQALFSATSIAAG